MGGWWSVQIKSKLMSTKVEVEVEATIHEEIHYFIHDFKYFTAILAQYLILNRYF